MTPKIGYMKRRELKKHKTKTKPYRVFLKRVFRFLFFTFVVTTILVGISLGIDFLRTVLAMENAQYTILTNILEFLQSERDTENQVDSCSSIWQLVRETVLPGNPRDAIIYENLDSSNSWSKSTSQSPCYLPKNKIGVKCRIF